MISACHSRAITLRKASSNWYHSSIRLRCERSVDSRGYLPFGCGELPQMEPALSIAQAGHDSGVAAKNLPRNRVMNDRLWDQDGRLWHRPFEWLDRDQVDRLLPQLGRLVVHRYHAPLRYLSGREALAWWSKVRPHTQTSEQVGVVPDKGGFTYAAASWTSDSDRLLVVEQDC